MKTIKLQKKLNKAFRRMLQLSVAVRHDAERVQTQAMKRHYLLLAKLEQLTSSMKGAA